MFDPYSGDPNYETPVTDNDALGGAGSVGGAGSTKNALLAIALGGLSRAVDGAASKKYALTYFNDGTAVNANGQTTTRGAPGATPSVGQATADAVKNPLVIGIAVAVLAGVAIIWALKR